LTEVKTSFSNYLRFAKVRHYLDILYYAQKKQAKQIKTNLNVGFREAKFLLQVKVNPGSSLTKIQKLQFLPSSTAAWLADRLVNKGFLSRRQNPNNRREVILDLTDEGNRLVKQIDKMFFTKEVDEGLSAVSDETVIDIEQNLRTLCKLYGMKVD